MSVDLSKVTELISGWVRTCVSRAQSRALSPSGVSRVLNSDTIKVILQGYHSMKISVHLSPFLALPMSVWRPAFWDLAGLFLNVHHCVSESPHESFLCFSLLPHLWPWPCWTYCRATVQNRLNRKNRSSCLVLKLFHKSLWETVLVSFPHSLKN